MTQRNSEIGRTLMETMAVLVVIAILLLASLAGYNFLVRKYKEDQTVKAISELAVRYKVRPVTPKEGEVRIKDVYPEVERADALHMRTMDTASGRVSLDAENTSYFVVSVNAILGDSCESRLLKGDYDAVLATDEYVKGSDYFAIGRDLLKKLDAGTLTSEQETALTSWLGEGIELTRENVINRICVRDDKGKIKTMGLVFGDKCPKMGGSYYYQGKCWPCPEGKKEDKNGQCCDNVNACGYCNQSP